MTLEEDIKLSLKFFPTLFGRREQVLEHMFVVLGNGYQWVNGKLLSNSHCENYNRVGLDEETPIEKEIIDGMIERAKKNPIFWYPLCEYSINNIPDDVEEEYLSAAEEVLEFMKRDLSREDWLEEVKESVKNFFPSNWDEVAEEEIETYKRQRDHNAKWIPKIEKRLKELRDKQVQHKHRKNTIGNSRL
jgi:hypothetical protein